MPSTLRKADEGPGAWGTGKGTEAVSQRIKPGTSGLPLSWREPGARSILCWAELRGNLHGLFLPSPRAKGGGGEELLRGAVVESRRRGFETRLSPVPVLWSWVD